jgi:predicted amidohydrolase YtcJ
MGSISMCGRSIAICGLLAVALCAGCSGGGGGSFAPADAIYFDANVETMNAVQPNATALAITGTGIVAVGSNSTVFANRGPKTVVTDLHGATVLPGFIDPHSHLMAYAFFSDQLYWTDVSSVNLYFKPLPGDPRCPNPSDYQQCFIPVQNEHDVISRMTSAAAAARTGSFKGVFAANYDPGRLGHDPECGAPVTKVGFQCPNLEDGMAREHLDAVAADMPVFVTSESGHVTFANTEALRELNICGTDVSDPASCHTPTTNPEQEEALAQAGQLDEDLSFTSIGFFETQILQSDPSAVSGDITRGVSLYAQHGYTLNQEGAASTFEVNLYLKAIKEDAKFPLTAAMLMYDPASADFGDTVAMAKQAQGLINNNPDIFIAALKSFADGSPQEYTGYLTQQYLNIFLPFTWSIFPQPYRGLPDLAEDEIAGRVVVAHSVGYPLVVHQNGDDAINDSVGALQMANEIMPTPKFRDLVLHAPMIDAANLAIVAKLNDPISFLMDDLYYWGLPECQQIIGPKRTNQISSLYPAADAENMGLHVTLHSDTPVSPPDPLFEIWVAKTRQTQQPSWYPNFAPSQCPIVFSPGESISIAQGIQAFTTNAAWQYGMEKQLGSITPGFTADLVFLSADPLSMENDPDNLSSIRVLGTVHRGTFIANPNANQPPIWPD